MKKLFKSLKGREVLIFVKAFGSQGYAEGILHDYDDEFVYLGEETIMDAVARSEVFRIVDKRSAMINVVNEVTGSVPPQHWN